MHFFFSPSPFGFLGAAFDFSQDGSSTAVAASSLLLKSCKQIAKKTQVRRNELTIEWRSHPLIFRPTFLAYTLSDCRLRYDLILCTVRTMTLEFVSAC